MAKGKKDFEKVVHANPREAFLHDCAEAAERIALLPTIKIARRTPFSVTATPSDESYSTTVSYLDGAVEKSKFSITLDRNGNYAWKSEAADDLQGLVGSGTSFNRILPVAAFNDWLEGLDKGPGNGKIMSAIARHSKRANAPTPARAARPEAGSQPG